MIFSRYKYILVFIILSCSSSIHAEIFDIIRVSKYESLSADSINKVLSDAEYPFIFSADSIYDMLNIAQTYTIHIDNCCNCFYSITKVSDYFYIYIAELVVGYDIYFIYNNKTKKLYLTDKFNFNSQSYKIMYNSSDFIIHFIMVRYEDGMIEIVPLKICNDITIKL